MFEKVWTTLAPTTGDSRWDMRSKRGNEGDKTFKQKLNQWYFIFFFSLLFFPPAVNISNMLIYLCYSFLFSIIYAYRADALDISNSRIFRIWRFHGSISQTARDDRPFIRQHKRFFIKDYRDDFFIILLKIENISCCFPGISERNVQNVVAQLQRRIGWDEPGSLYSILPVLLATNAVDNSQQVNNLLC